MTEEKIPNLTSMFNVFDTYEQAVAFRKKLMHAHLYGIYGMWKSEEKQLWVVMPLVALQAWENFQEP